MSATSVEDLPGRTRATCRSPGCVDLAFRAKTAERQLTDAREEIAALKAEVMSLKETNKALLERIDELERAGKRQASPFSKGPPKKKPKPLRQVDQRHSVPS